MTDTSGNRFKSTAEKAGAEGCLVVHPYLKLKSKGGAAGRNPDARLEETVRLAGAIDLRVVHSEIINISKYRAATLFGSGTVDRLARMISEAGGNGDGIEVTIVDGILSPVQQRNLERALKCKIIDRAGLILEIFGARARTREGVMQVELAALTYQRSRLVRSWTHLERQRGGFGFMGGPGETQIEADRRMISQRITRLKRNLKDVARTRALHRKARRRVPYPVVALVGYTNAGKSTLFNVLTQADVTARNQLFDTLDPTMRGADLPSGRTIILSDTVGFISDLPHELVTAFRATLEEVTEADLIVHVRDAAHPESDSQKEDVLVVLRNLGVDNGAEGIFIEVLNKIDLLDAETKELLANRTHRANAAMVLVSAKTGEGCPALLGVLDDRLAQASKLLDITVTLSDGASIAWLYDHGDVISRTDAGGDAHFKVRLDPADAARFENLRAVD